MGKSKIAIASCYLRSFSPAILFRTVSAAKPSHPPSSPGRLQQLPTDLPVFCLTPLLVRALLNHYLLKDPIAKTSPGSPISFQPHLPPILLTRSQVLFFQGFSVHSISCIATRSVLTLFYVHHSSSHCLKLFHVWFGVVSCAATNIVPVHSRTVFLKLGGGKLFPGTFAMLQGGLGCHN